MDNGTLLLNNNNYSNGDGTLILNGIIYSGTSESGIDVSDTTAIESDVLLGKLFHKASGELTTGTLVPKRSYGNFTLTSSDQEINIGFKPTAVMVGVNIGSTSYYGVGYNLLGNTIGSRAATTSSSNQSPCSIVITDTGFTVKSASSSYNKSSVYIAI